MDKKIYGEFPFSSYPLIIFILNNLFGHEKRVSFVLAIWSIYTCLSLRIDL